MLIAEVILKYDSIVSFPITLAKIRKAGRDPREYLTAMLEELTRCTDSDRCSKLIGKYRELRHILFN